MAAINDAEGDLAAKGGITEYMGDIMLNAGVTDKAREHYDAALSYRQQSSINDANKAQAARNHTFKMAVASLVDEDATSAAATAAEYSADVESGGGTNFERRRVHELAGYRA